MTLGECSLIIRAQKSKRPTRFRVGPFLKTFSAILVFRGGPPARFWRVPKSKPIEAVRENSHETESLTQTISQSEPESFTGVRDLRSDVDWAAGWGGRPRPRSTPWSTSTLMMRKSAFSPNYPGMALYRRRLPHHYETDAHANRSLLCRAHPQLRLREGLV